MANTIRIRFLTARVCSMGGEFQAPFRKCDSRFSPQTRAFAAAYSTGRRRREGVLPNSAERRFPNRLTVPQRRKCPFPHKRPFFSPASRFRSKPVWKRALPGVRPSPAAATSKISILLDFPHDVHRPAIGFALFFELGNTPVRRLCPFPAKPGRDLSLVTSSPTIKRVLHQPLLCVL